jgi:hypothetical protein
MRIADSDSIKAGEQELIASIMEKMDPETLARVAGKNLVPDQMEFVRGDMVIRGERIVYQMDFKVTLDVTVMFDRHGDLIGDGVDDAQDSAGELPAQESVDDLQEEVPPHDSPEENEPADFVDDHEDTAKASMDDDMDAVLSRTRDFWQRKRDEATVGEG